MNLRKPEKDKYHMISLTQGIERKKLTNEIETDSKLQRTD